VSLADAVADDVRRRMSAAELSARELARRTGIPATLVHRAVAGDRPLTLDEVERIAAVFGTRPDVMLRAAVRRMHTPRPGDVQK
jgi:plasmid maintenance system antidote protein VapI